MQFRHWLENRQKGLSLPELDPEKYGYKGAKAVIYRAVVATQDSFQSMDYVTMSLKFARGHAEHTAVVEEEPAHVMRARVPAIQVFAASNVGEYFYDGPPIVGQIVYKTKNSGTF